MKKIKTIKALFLIIIVLFSFHLQAQEKFILSTGLGFSDFFNLGVRYQINQVQIGFKFGTISPGSKDESFSLSSDFYYHFGGKSKYTNINPWYTKIGLAYLINKNEERIGKNYYFDLRIGRDFNLSNKFGIYLDGGILVLLKEEEKRIKPNDNFFNLSSSNFPILPNFGIGLFYKL